MIIFILTSNFNKSQKTTCIKKQKENCKNLDLGAVKGTVQILMCFNKYVAWLAHFRVLFQNKF